MVLLGLLPLVRVVDGQVSAKETGAVVEVVENNSTPGDKGGVATLIHSTLEVHKGITGDHGIRLLVKGVVLATVAG